MKTAAAQGFVNDHSITAHMCNHKEFIKKFQNAMRHLQQGPMKIGVVTRS